MEVTVAIAKLKKGKAPGIYKSWRKGCSRIVAHDHKLDVDERGCAA